MSIKDDLSTQLSTYLGLTALIGTRIYPIEAPQKEKNAHCVFTIVDDQREYSHQGFSGIEEERIQISVYALTTILAEQIKEQVIAAMEAWPGSNSKVQSCFHDGEQDLIDPETLLVHLPVDFLVQYG